MAYAKTAMKIAEEYLFGENVQLSTIQSLYAKAFMCNIRFDVDRDVVKKINMELIKIDISDLGRQLENAIIKEMPDPSSKDYNKHLAMKCYSFIIRGAFTNKLKQTEFIPEFLKRAVHELEPIKFEPEGIFLYIRSLNALGNMSFDMRQYQNSINYLKKAEKTYEEFEAMGKNVNKKPMSDFELFGVKKTSKNLFQYLHNRTIIYLYTCYDWKEDETMKLQYIRPHLKAEFANLMIEHGHNLEDIDFATVVFNLRNPIYFLILTHQFAQIDHLLSLLLFHLVKLRRISPQQGKKHDEIIHAQAIISESFAFWAYKIIKYNHMMKLFHDFTLKYPINNEVIRFEEFIEPGVEIYEKQFPCEIISSNKEMKKVLKKGKAWCQRALVLFGDVPEENFKSVSMMRQFVNLETNPESVFDFWKISKKFNH